MTRTFLQPKTRIRLREKPYPVEPLKKLRPFKFRWLPSLKAIKAPSKDTFGFKVLIRQAGKKVKGKWRAGGFKALTEFVLPRAAALALGQSRVAAKAGRTFKLVPTFGKPAEIPKLPKFRPEMFTKKGRVFTERTKFAIDTLGELEEITKKGIKASQKKAFSLYALTAFRKPKTKKRR